MSNFKHLGIIIKHEFMAIAAKKSFIIMTLLIPLLFLASMGIPLLIMALDSFEMETVAIIDNSGKYGKAIADNEEFHFIDITPVGTDSIKAFFNKTENLYAIAVIPAGIDKSLSLSLYSDKAIRKSLQDHIASCLNDTLTNARIASYGIPRLAQIIDDSKASVSLSCIKWDKEGNEAKSDADIASLFGLALTFITSMFIMMYGAMILNSIIEEKSNRIIEVMVSCCKPLELMFGKIIGVGLVGLTQIAIWVILISATMFAFGIGSVLTGGATAAQSMAQLQNQPDHMMDVVQAFASIDIISITLCFVMYFIGGYLLFGSLFAACGAAVDQPNDASQVTTPFMIILMVAMWIGLACVENPDSNIAWWGSMIPLTSPIVMLARLPYDVPLWEIILSMALLYASAFGVTVLSAKIFRTGILMYGKKFTWKTLFLWLKK